MTMTSSETIPWGRGFFRIWVLLSVVWISGAIWVQSNPPIQSGPPPFDETQPFLRNVPGVQMESLADCEPAAKQDPRVDLQNCIEYFRTERMQPLWRYVRSTAWAFVPPLVLLFSVRRLAGLFGVFGAYRTRYKTGEGRQPATKMAPNSIQKMDLRGK